MTESDEYFELLEEQHQYDVILHLSQKDAECQNTGENQS